VSFFLIPSFLVGEGHRLSVLGVLLEVLGDAGPVHHIPPGSNVLGASGLVLQVVGVLPDIQAQNGDCGSSLDEAVHQGIVLVGSRDHNQLSALVHAQPAKSRAEQSDCLVGKLFLHSVNGPERGGDGLGKGGRRLSGLVRGTHDSPEKSVVVVTPPMVSDGTPLLEGDVLHLHESRTGEVRARDGSIELGHVSIVVVLVVEVHGLLVDIGLKSLVGVGEVRELEGRHLDLACDLSETLYCETNEAKKWRGFEGRKKPAVLAAR